MASGGNIGLDVLAVGDVVTDAFIKLYEERAHTYHNEDGQWLALPFASKVPFERSEVVEGVGNAANAAVAFSRLGLKSGLVSNTGDDKAGRGIQLALKRRGVDSRFIHENPGKSSNYHYVLWYKDERTILIRHESYDYQWPRFRATDVPAWIYFSSISSSALDSYHDEIADWLEQNHKVRFAFQPGTFQLEAGAKRLERLYKRCQVLVVNRDEAALISGLNRHDVSAMMAALHKLGPQVVAITDGPAGAYASDGRQRLKMPPYPDPAPPVERTGAGDAFTATFVAACIRGASLEGALQWAPINSMSVVQQVGAQAGLLTMDQLEERLAAAPDWYHASPF